MLYTLSIQLCIYPSEMFRFLLLLLVVVVMVVVEGSVFLDSVTYRSVAVPAISSP